MTDAQRWARYLTRLRRAGASPGLFALRTFLADVKTPTMPVIEGGAEGDERFFRATHAGASGTGSVRYGPDGPAQSAHAG